MSAKHTPGPWKVKVEREGGINSAARIDLGYQCDTCADACERGGW